MAQDDRPYDPLEISYRENESWRDRIQRITNNLFLDFMVNKDGDTYFIALIKMALGIDAVDEPYSKHCPNSTTASTKRMGQSEREFFNEVKQIAEEVGGSLGEVQNAVREWRTKRTEEAAKICCELLVQIYACLREKGYSITDLRR